MKKFLSLVLALAMTMSLVTISAGAKDFTDADDITYVEAVEVMTAIGVVDGDTAGNFNPTNGLTRGAAAKIICNLILGPTTAAALNADANPYKDVDKNSTFAGYIAFCQKEGIISGYADGTFKPAAPLTGYAFMKMLLGALGYDVEVEGYTGSNWSINVAKRAINIGLDDGLTEAFNGSAYVTREEAMLYAFNALQADMVTYDTTITIGDVTIAGSKAETMANNTKTDGNIGSKDGVMQFAEMYFTNLKDSDADDAFMRPATTWKIKSEEVGTYAETPDLVYTAAVKMGTIYSDLGLTDGIDKSDITIYEDGVKCTKTDWTKLSIVKAGLDKMGGNGAELDVYYNDDADTVTIVIVNTYVGEVNAVYKATAAKDAYVTLKTGDYTGPGGSFEIDGLSKEDIVAYTYSNKIGEKCIESMYVPETVSGTMTTATSTGSVTVGGTKYDANIASKTKITEFNTTIDKGTDVTVYLDEYGYALYVDGTTTKEYAVVLDLMKDVGGWNDNVEAKLLFTDGTTKTVGVVTYTDSGKVYLNYDENAAAGYQYTGEIAFDSTSSKKIDGSVEGGKLSQYDIVSYTIDSDGDYELTLVADTRSVAGSKTLVTNGNNSLNMSDSNYFNIGGSSTNTCTKADGATIFLTVNKESGKKDTYSVYEGFAAVPTMKTKSSGTTTAVFKDTGDNAATIVFVLNDKANVDVSSSNSDLLYVKGDSTGRSYDTNGNYFYQYDAYLNGVETTVKSASRIAVHTLYDGPRYDTNGLLTGADETLAVLDLDNTLGVGGTALTYKAGTDLFTGIGSDVVKNNVVTLGGQALAYTSDVDVYFIDRDGEIRVGSIGEINHDIDDSIIWKIDDDGLVTDIYVREYEADGTSTPNGNVIGNVAPQTMSYASGNFTVSTKTSVAIAAGDAYTVTIYQDGYKVATKNDTFAAAKTVDTVFDFTVPYASAGTCAGNYTVEVSIAHSGTVYASGTGAVRVAG